MSRKRKYNSPRHKFSKGHKRNKRKFLAAVVVRLYPTQEQKTIINQQCGCCRYIFNKILAYKTGVWSAENRDVPGDEVSRYISALKCENPWLKDSHSKALQQSILDLNTAMKNCFQNGSGFPQFKKKIDRNDSFRLPVDAFGSVDGNRISFTRKLKDMLFDCSKHHMHLLNKFQRNVRSITIRRNPDNTYTASVLINFRDIRNFKTEKRLDKVQKTQEAEGYDMGLNSFTTDSHGHKTPKVNVDKAEKRHEKMQRRHSRHRQRALEVWKKQQAKLPKEERQEHMRDSRRLEKSRVRAARAARKVRNLRASHHHGISSDIINSKALICLESLNVSGMMKNHKLARAIQRQAFFMFFNMLKYKAEWYNRHIVQVGQFFASSKLCHECGYRNGLLRLSEREWVCPECGALLDRDVNAARNILSEALRILGADGCLVKGTLPSSSGKVKHAENPTMDDKDAAHAAPLKSSGSVKREKNVGQITNIE